MYVFLVYSFIIIIHSVGIRVYPEMLRVFWYIDMVHVCDEQLPSAQGAIILLAVKSRLSTKMAMSMR